MDWYFFEPGPGFTLQNMLSGIPDELYDWLEDAFGGNTIRPGWVLVVDGEIIEWVDATGRYA